VEIAFANRKLEKTFNDERALARTYGTDMTSKIKLRMAVLRAAGNLGQVPAEKPMRRHELTGDLKGHFAVDLVHPFRLVFRPTHEPVPRKPDHGIDLEKVTAIEITSVTDYH
jgi:plasmid maintenance system killer protein